jgi:hypothetical protein
MLDEFERRNYSPHTVRSYAKLKRLVSELSLEKLALKDIAAGNSPLSWWRPGVEPAHSAPSSLWVRMHHKIPGLNS